MRILFLALDVDLSKQRGDTIHAVELASALAKLGHEVALLVGSGGAASALAPPGVAVHAASGSDWRVLSAVRAVLREFPPDVVYERRSTPKISFAVRLQRSLPTVMELNGVLRDELAFQGRRPGSGPILSAKRWARAAMLRKIDRFVAVSHSIAADLVNTHHVDAARIHVIGNGVNTGRFRPIPKDEACRHTGLTPERPRIVFVGNFVPWWDFDIVLKGHAAVRGHHPDAELVLAGDGQERSRLESQAQAFFPDSSVRFLREVPYDQVPYFIGSSDVCLLPAKQRSGDISPLKLFEYLACARPVVASAVPGLEIVDSLGVGRLVPPDDAGALGVAVGGLIDDPAARRDMGERGRVFAEHERSWQSVASRVASVLELAAGRR